MKFAGWVALSVLVNLGLFGWMRNLVKVQDATRDVDETRAAVALVNVDLPPPEPPKPSATRPTPKMKALAVPASMPAMAAPALALSPARPTQAPSTPVLARPQLGPMSVKGRMISGPAANFGSGGTKGAGGAVMQKLVRAAPEPTLKVPPRYPPAALRDGIEGWVKVAFVIDARGRPTKVRVHSAKPPEVFDVAAVRAVRKWSYPKQSHQVQATVTLEFQMQGVR